MSSKQLQFMLSLVMPMVGVSILATSAPVLAESVIEEVIVTAQKREESVQDVGIAITAFSGEQMEALHLTNGTDVANFTPGVHISGNNGGATQQFTIRGSTQNDFADIAEGPNAVYVDEAYQATGQSQLFANFDMERVEALVNAGADIINVDTAHGHSENVIKTVRQIKKAYDIEVIAGNVATKEGAGDLISAGADAIKVGIGPGSICTTRIISGTGVPQVTAIQEASEIADQYGISVIADGGIKNSGDIAKAIAAGARVVMIGSLFAGTEESPGEIVYMEGRKCKKYRGMGSIRAMQMGSKDRYGQTDSHKLVPEGVEGVVPYRGTVSEMVFQMVGGLRSAMGYCGCRTISDMRRKAKFVRITKEGMRESHPHDVTITEDSPNYWINE